MKREFTIHHLQREKIDSQKWNDAIAHSKVGTIYNYSSVLDALFPQWSALMIGDYEFIFPMTLSKKWGITYFYPPLFHSYFSIFSANSVTEEIQTAFLTEINNYCTFYEFPFLPIEPSLPFPKGILALSKVGQFLNLNQEISALQQKYTKQLVRNLKKSQRLNLRFEVSNSLIQEVVQTFKHNVGHKLKELTPSSYDTLTRFIQTTTTEGTGKIYACFNNDRLLAIGFFTFSNQRIIYHKGGNTPEGKKISAMSALIDHVLLTHSNSDFCFDFGGSSIPSLMHYNHSFGTDQHTFYTLMRTPYFVRCIKFLKNLISFKNRLAKTK